MRRPNLSSQGGQLVVEAILILTVLMFMVFMASRYFKNEEFLKKLIHGPWQNLAGMLQNGVWGTPEQTGVQHPNGHFRHIVIVGEPSQ